MSLLTLVATLVAVVNNHSNSMATEVAQPSGHIVMRTVFNAAQSHDMHSTLITISIRCHRHILDFSADRSGRPIDDRG
jgi:hypothetical protein